MKSIWETLEKQTSQWNALSRQSLAGEIWADYVLLRFNQTGDTRAFDFLYPYLNHADKQTRKKAIGIACQVFKGRGAKAIRDSSYFTDNPDPFLRDRAVKIIGAAVTGLKDAVILETLRPYLNHKNQFIRLMALEELGKAATGLANNKIYQEIIRVSKTFKNIKKENVLYITEMAIARVYAGKPTEEIYNVLKPTKPLAEWENFDETMPVLFYGASKEWYDRAYKEIYEPGFHLHEHPDQKDNFMIRFTLRECIEGWCHISRGMGIEALKTMLHLRIMRCPGYALLNAAQELFIGADVEKNKKPLTKMIKTGDIPAQRIAILCLAQMMKSTCDKDTVKLLKEMCKVKSRAVRSIALSGLGLVARSSCDESLKQICLEHIGIDETAKAGIHGLGLLFLGSGRDDVFEIILSIAERFRNRPAKVRYSKPLAVCYWTAGLIYLGTGSRKPLDFLLDILNLPQMPHNFGYQWYASKALLMSEFPETALKCVIRHSQGIRYPLGRDILEYS